MDRFERNINVMSPEERVKLTLHEVETRIKNLNYEEGVIIGRDGNVIHEKRGEASNVRVSSHELKGKIFTHNHPNGKCGFSVYDVNAFIKSDIYELRTVVAKGHFFSLKKGNTGVNVDFAQKFYDEFVDNMRLYANAFKIARQKILMKKPSMEQINEEEDNIISGWLEKNAAKYGYIFTKGVI